MQPFNIAIIELVEFIEEVSQMKLKKKRLFAYDLMQKDLKGYLTLRDYVAWLKEEQTDPKGKDIEIN